MREELHEVLGEIQHDDDGYSRYYNVVGLSELTMRAIKGMAGGSAVDRGDQTVKT